MREWHVLTKTLIRQKHMSKVSSFGITHSLEITFEIVLRLFMNMCTHLHFRRLHDVILLLVRHNISMCLIKKSFNYISNNYQWERKKKRKRFALGSLSNLSFLKFHFYFLLKGDFRKGLKYHEQEICLSEAASDQIGAAIAHRKVGECHCELGNYRDAIHHQKQHLRIARCLGKFHI